MVNTRWGGLRIEPYDPDARDADGDGIVQEGSSWERPAGTQLVDELGNAIQRGITSTERPKGMRVVGADGKDVAYTPSYGDKPAGGAGKPTPLGGMGYPSLKERGLRSVQEIVSPEPQPAPQPRQSKPYESPLKSSTAMASAEDVQKAIAEFDALPDDQLVVVYHGTTSENAAKIRESGVSGFDPRGDDVSAVSKGRGMYVAATSQDAEMYVGRSGGEVVAVTVPKSSLTVSPEMTTDGATVGYALHNPSAGAVIPDGTAVSVKDVSEPEVDWVPRWEEITEVLDMDFIREYVRGGDNDDDELLYEFFDRLKSAWETWDDCRETRKAAYELAGIDISPADPNIDRSGGYFGNGWGTARSEEEMIEMAKYLMASLVQDVKSGKGWDNPTLYRAITVARADEDAFWETMQPGNMVDIPLLSFADRRSQGQNELLTRYGSDVLLQVEGKPHSFEMGSMGGYYDAASERETLDRIDDIIESLKSDQEALDKVANEEEWDSLDEKIDEIQELLRDYSKAKDYDDRQEVREQIVSSLEDYFGGDPIRWEGEEIPEEDSDMYYASIEDPWSNRSTTPVERVSGGRFEVIAVENDPTNTYGSIVRVRQVGAFDPQQPGKLVKAEKS
jgi:hypothetical protein